MSERVWHDGCDHPEDSFLGVVWTRENGKRKAYDVYVFEDSMGASVCLRYGDGDSEYISPGSLRSLAARLKTKPVDANGNETEWPEFYTKAFELIKSELAKSLADSCRARAQGPVGDSLFRELAAFIELFA